VVLFSASWRALLNGREQRLLLLLVFSFSFFVFELERSEFGLIKKI
jgi:hypothetical protein